MPVRISKRVLTSILTLLGISIIAVAALANWSLSSKFGKVEIPLRDGSKIYAIRESWGLSSEQLSLTRNPDGCIPADAANDYVYRNPSDNSLLYSVTPDGIVLYDYPFSPILSEPTNTWTNIKVTVSRSKTPFYDDVHADPQKYGATLAKIPLNETCWRNIFRRANSLR